MNEWRTEVGNGGAVISSLPPPTNPWNLLERSNIPWHWCVRTVPLGFFVLFLSPIHHSFHLCFIRVHWVEEVEQAKAKWTHENNQWNKRLKQRAGMRVGNGERAENKTHQIRLILGLDCSSVLLTLRSVHSPVPCFTPFLTYVSDNITNLLNVLDWRLNLDLTTEESVGCLFPYD